MTAYTAHILCHVHWAFLRSYSIYGYAYVNPYMAFICIDCNSFALIAIYRQSIQRESATVALMAPVLWRGLVIINPYSNFGKFG